MSNKRYAIIVAGGSGNRAGTELPKQFVTLNGLPVLAWSINKFAAAGAEVIVVLPEAHISTWQKMLQVHKDIAEHQTVTGGLERFHSVKNALAVLPQNTEAVVAVHDAARPFVSSALIVSIFEQCHIWKSCIPVVPVKDSLRRQIGDKLAAVDRKQYYAVQTPQVFRLPMLQQAYQQPYHHFFTDCASVFEAAGNPVQTMPGEELNFKITTAADLAYAQYLAENKVLSLK